MNIRNGRLGALHEGAAVRELLGDEARMRTELVLGERRHRFERVRRERAAGHRRAVLLEVLRNRFTDFAEHHADGGHEEDTISPEGKRVRQAFPVRKHARAWIAPLQLADDDLRIAENVRANLHHRRLAIAAGERE